MTDEEKNIEINDLFDLLMKSTKELFDLDCKEDKTGYEAKKEEVQLLQRIIVEKRAEHRPGHSL